MDENTQKLIQVVSKHVDDDKKDLALQFLLETIKEKQQQNYKNSVEMNKFILYEVNEYIKTLSRKPKIISFDDNIPKYENIDSILERTIQERQHIDIDTFPSYTASIDKKEIDDYENNSIPTHSQINIEQLDIGNNEEKKTSISSIDTTISQKESTKMMTDYNEKTLLYEDANSTFIGEKKATEDIKLNVSSIVWIDTIKTNEDNTLIISIEKEWKKSIILQIALDKQYGIGDFIHINGTFFQKVGYTQNYTQYNIYKGEYPCSNDNFDVKITTYPDGKIIEWCEEYNPLLIQISHQH